jgi:hypothetical protein
MINAGAKHYLVNASDSYFDKNIMVGSVEGHFLDGMNVIYIVNKLVHEQRMAIFMRKNLDSVQTISDISEFDANEKKIYVLPVDMSPSESELDAIGEIIKATEKTFFAFDTVKIGNHSLCSEETSEAAFKHSSRIGIRATVEAIAKVPQQTYYEFFTPVV